AQPYPCQVAYGIITTESNSFKPAAFSDWVTRVFNMQSATASGVNAAIKIEIGATLINTYGGIQATGYSSAQDIIFQSMMIHQLSDSIANFIAAAGGSGQTAMMNLGIAQGEQQTQNQWVIAGELAKKYLPMFRGMAEGFIYGLFPAAFLAMLLPGGGRTIKMYGLGILWIQSWSPLYSILNHYIFKYSAKAINGSLGLTQTSYAGINSGAQDMLAVLGMMGTTIPMVALAMIKGAEMGGSAMLGAVSSAMSSAAHLGSTVATTGNISLGNASLGNTNFGMNSAFQNNLAYSLSSGNHLTTYANRHDYSAGSRYDYGGSPIGISASDVIGAGLQEKMQQGATAINSNRSEYSHSVGNILREAYGTHANAEHSQGASSEKSFGQTAQIGEGLSQVMNWEKSFAKNHNVSIEKAHDIVSQAAFNIGLDGGVRTLSAPAGKAGILPSGGLNANLNQQNRLSDSDRTLDQEGVFEAEHFLQKVGYERFNKDLHDYAARRNSRTQNEIKEGTGSSLEAELYRSDQALRFAGSTFSQMQEFSKVQDYFEHHKEETHVDLTPKFLAWAALNENGGYTGAKFERLFANPTLREAKILEWKRLFADEVIDPLKAKMSIESHGGPLTQEAVGAPLRNPDQIQQVNQVAIAAGNDIDFTKSHLKVDPEIMGKKMGQETQLTQDQVDKVQHQNNQTLIGNSLLVGEEGDRLGDHFKGRLEYADRNVKDLEKEASQPKELEKIYNKIREKPDQEN
ncbi:MAG: conjugal transfer protein TraG N-terminal domain-containing protein, partial [Nitrospiria bacterium]